MVVAMLSTNLPQSKIDRHIGALQSAFSDFEPDALICADPFMLSVNVMRRKCGNVSILMQMNALKANIGVMRNIDANEPGGLDAFVASDRPFAVAHALGADRAKYKLSQMRIPLVLGYLCNVGIDTFRPDGHLIRMLTRLGFAQGNNDEQRLQGAVEAVESFAADCVLPVHVIGAALNRLCAVSSRGICADRPDCAQCRLSSHCRFRDDG
jgi:hypothetical protein